MKALFVTDTLLRYPDHNIPFQIEADASDYQLGSVIKQNGYPGVAYYFRKLNSAQRNYTTIEKELLYIVETFKAFRSMLLGAQITVYTGHRKLTHELGSFSTRQFLPWRLYLEEYNPIFKYIKGEDNNTADAFSRLPRLLTSFGGGVVPVQQQPATVPLLSKSTMKNYYNDSYYIQSSTTRMTTLLTTLY
jgi:hypothetical protein